MPPKESDSLLTKRQQAQRSSLTKTSEQQQQHLSFEEQNHHGHPTAAAWSTKKICIGILVAAGVTVAIIVALVHMHKDGYSLRAHKSNPNATYVLKEAHHGQAFFACCEFSGGPDSLGSAGYNTYVSQERAEELDIMSIEEEDGVEYVVMKSAAGTTRDDYGNRFRESIRLEGKKRFDKGLIILDVKHMPYGCGVWPAFWTTDEHDWPNHGEIDIVEGINTQDVVKTALHTSDQCSMYAHVPRWEWTGEWDTATGIPDTYTGMLNYNTQVEADNCWVMAPHQWANQGCVAVANETGTIGKGMNKRGGGAYVLEWDPDNGYMKSWVFKNGQLPQNLIETMDSADSTEKGKDSNVTPDPSSWGTPYAYFAVGERTGCSADHFLNHHLVINLAFCGTVAGNRFQRDCPALYEKYNVHNDSVLTCNAYIDSDPDALSEAYWKIRGVYLYQRG
ncbi:MAG: hypothetical protein SGILL_008658 [Bacillariaceae sp.]